MDQYNNIARLYDLVLEPFVHYIRKHLASWVAHRKPENLLDLGCGTGKQLSLFPKCISFYGIDISYPMLDQSNKNVRAKSVLGDMRMLPFPDNSFEIIYTQFVLHENKIQILDEILSEVKRILKPGGLYVVIDYAIPERQKVWTVISRKGIKTIENLAGDEHFLNYKIWLKNGGIDGLIQRDQWKMISERSFYGGNVKMNILSDYSNSISQME